jgi:hypothetical protein
MNKFSQPPIIITRQCSSQVGQLELDSIEIGDFAIIRVQRNGPRQERLDLVRLAIPRGPVGHRAEVECPCISARIRFDRSGQITSVLDRSAANLSPT